MEDKRETIQEKVVNKDGEFEGYFIPNYKKKEKFITGTEYKFYIALKEIYKENKNIEIFTQVALNSIIQFNNKRIIKDFGYFKFEDRSIDFVIYNANKNICNIEYCIELNDKTHEENKNRIERDKILKTIFKVAKIDLKFIKVKDIEKTKINSTEYFNQQSIKRLLNI